MPLASEDPTKNARAVIKVCTSTNAEAPSRSRNWVAAKYMAVSIASTCPPPSTRTIPKLVAENKNTSAPAETIAVRSCGKDMAKRVFSRPAPSSSAASSTSASSVAQTPPIVRTAIE